jgi:hypothetical protein
MGMLGRMVALGAMGKCLLDGAEMVGGVLFGHGRFGVVRKVVVVDKGL